MMKPIIVAALCTCLVQAAAAQLTKDSPNIIIITIDGFRWQEMFEGADPALLVNPKYVQDTSLIQEQFGGASPEIRRKNLMPFFWTTIARKGQLYGNRNYDNKANVKNFYKISYAGYTEIFTGYADPKLVPNTPRINNIDNLPGYLNTRAAYKGKCVAFSSWNIFPYILREGYNNLPVNSGYENMEDSGATAAKLNEVQDSVHEKKSCRYDLLTFLMAKQYIQQQHPKLVVLGFGETDEFAHNGKYDMYLQRVNDIDRMIAGLWYNVQTDPFYKNNTTLIITTDHGRGRKTNTWPGHHLFIKGSGEIWLAMLGQGIEPLGEVKSAGQIYQNQIAQTIAGLIGLPFESLHTTGKPIQLPVVNYQQTGITTTALVK